jgi:hypothetical protein
MGIQHTIFDFEQVCASTLKNEAVRIKLDVFLLNSGVVLYHQQAATTGNYCQSWLPW